MTEYDAEYDFEYEDDGGDEYVEGQGEVLVDDVPYEHVRDWVLTEAQRREQEAEAQRTIWDDPDTLDALEHSVIDVEKQLGRRLTQRDFERFVDHYDRTGKPPTESFEEVLKDPHLETDEGRRRFMSERLQEGADQPARWED